MKAKGLGNVVENARMDYLDPRRNSLLVQALIDEAYKFLGLGAPPTVTASIEASSNGNKIHYNINLDDLSPLLGQNLNFHLGTPLTGIAHCNRFIWSAAEESCDLYLGVRWQIL